MKLKTFKEFLFESKKKDDEVEVDVTKAQQAYYKDLPKSTAQKKKSQIAKQAEMDDDDPNAYKELKDYLMKWQDKSKWGLSLGDKNSPNGSKSRPKFNLKPIDEE